MNVNSIGGFGSLNSASMVDMQKMKEKMFSRLDTNSNGSFDLSELSAGVKNGKGRGPLQSTMDKEGISVEQLFNKIDTDTSGTIDQTEMDTFMQSSRPPMPPPPSGSMQTGMSQTSSTGMLDSESVTTLLDYLNQLNSSDENDQSISSLMQQSTSSTSSQNTLSFDGLLALLQAGQSLSGGIGGTEGSNPPPLPDKAQMFSRMDSNGDGALNLEELKSIVENDNGKGPLQSIMDKEGISIEELFKKIDTDKSGSIDQTEMDTFMKSMRPPKPPGGMSASNTVSGSTTVSGGTTSLSKVDDSDEDDQKVSSQQQFFAQLEQYISSVFNQYSLSVQQGQSLNLFA